MAEFDLEIKIKSPLHLSSGEADLNVDADIIRDDFGIPFFSGRRLKGLLYESMLEIREMILLSIEKDVLNEINNIFHRTDEKNIFANSDYSLIYVNNFYPFKENQYENISKEWAYLEENYPDLITADDLLKSYSHIRFQTSLKDGIAKDGSLRNMRVLDEGISFYGKIILENESNLEKSLVVLGIKNIRKAGISRNRGFGSIEITGVDEDKKSIAELSKLALKTASIEREI